MATSAACGKTNVILNAQQVAQLCYFACYISFKEAGAIWDLLSLTVPTAFSLLSEHFWQARLPNFTISLLALAISLANWISSFLEWGSPSSSSLLTESNDHVTPVWRHSLLWLADFLIGLTSCTLTSLQTEQPFSWLLGSCRYLVLPTWGFLYASYSLPSAKEANKHVNTVTW